MSMPISRVEVHTAVAGVSVERQPRFDVFAVLLGQVAVVGEELVGHPLLLAPALEDVGVGLDEGATVGEDEVVPAAQGLEQVIGDRDRVGGVLGVVLGVVAVVGALGAGVCLDVAAQLQLDLGGVPAGVVDDGAPADP